MSFVVFSLVSIQLFLVFSDLFQSVLSIVDALCLLCSPFRMYLKVVSNMAAINRRCLLLATCFVLIAIIHQRSKAIFNYVSRLDDQCIAYFLSCPCPVVF